MPPLPGGPPGMGPPGAPPFAPGAPLGMPPPGFIPPAGSPPIPPPGIAPPPFAGATPHPPSGASPTAPTSVTPQPRPASADENAPPKIVEAQLPPIPVPSLKQENPEYKKGILKYTDANYSPVRNPFSLYLFSILMVLSPYRKNYARTPRNTSFRPLKPLMSREARRGPGLKIFSSVNMLRHPYLQAVAMVCSLNRVEPVIRKSQSVPSFMSPPVGMVIWLIVVQLALHSNMQCGADVPVFFIV